MPFNSTAPIKAFPSRKAPSPEPIDPKQQWLIEKCKNGDYDPFKQKRTKPRAITPPAPFPIKSLRAPLLPHHHESLRLAKHADVEPTDKRISAVHNESKNVSPLSTRSPREIKKVIGPWNLGATLGEGATGRVRKARHIVSGQVAAVKIMSKLEAANFRSQSVMNMDVLIASEKTKDGEDRLPFGLEREIVIMKLIHHESIIKLYDLWENRGEIYLVLEYVECGELFKYVFDRGRLDERETMRIFRQLISAVCYCHSFRLCHRDVKPENIMVDKIGNVKLVDFGMATREHLGGLDTPCGSPHYVPPELCQGTKYCGAQVDMWSCGVVLYVMMEGKLPFGSTLDNNDVPGVLNEIQTIEPIYSKGYHDWTLHLMLQLLKKDPSERLNTDDIWFHPLVMYYGDIATTVTDPERWIGGPPDPLTTKDCGPGFELSELDNELVDGLCTLWHSLDRKEMATKLTSDKPNYEKVIYKNLLLFRTEQEANYEYLALEHTDSDVHRIHRRPARVQSRADLLGSIKRAPSICSPSSSRHLMRSTTKESRPVNCSSRSNLLGATKRPDPTQDEAVSISSTRSRYTIAAPPPSRSVSKQTLSRQSSRVSRRTSQRTQSDAQSYDPFRASSVNIPSSPPNQTKRLTFDQSSASSRYGYINYTASLRRPPVNNLQSDRSSATGSVPSAARDHLGHKRSLRRSVINRGPLSSSSWASTTISSPGIRQYSVPSIKHKRITQISNTVRRSPPPARPRNPTPSTMQQRYQRDGNYGSHSSLRPKPLVIVKKQVEPVQQNLNLPKGLTLVPPDNTSRTNTLWEEKTRQASLELSTLMDEVFSEGNIDAALWDAKVEEKKQEEFVRKSFDLPALRETGYTRPHPNINFRTMEAPPPCDDLPDFRTIYDADAVKELTRLRDFLESRVQDEGMSSLHPVIAHLNRLLREQREARRVVSAPQVSRRSKLGRSLSPITEEYDKPRHVSSPLKNRNGKWERSSFRGNKATIRLVNEHDEKLTPLKLKKNSSAPLLNSTYAGNDDKESPEGKHSKHRLGFKKSARALDKMFKRDASKSESIHVSSNESSPETTVPLTPPQNKSRKRESGDGKPRNWFRRSQVSSISNGSSSKSPSPLAKSSDEQTESNTKTSSEEFSLRVPKRESAGRRMLRFFKGQTKEKRMQIAVPSEVNDDWFDSPTQSGSVRGRIMHGKGSRSMDNHRHSRFAHSSSPHLFDTMTAHEPYTQSSGSTSLFARLFSMPIRQTSPAPQFICLQLPRTNAIHEIKNILRDWRRYGLCNIRVNSKVGTVRATVSENNTLNMQPVTFLATIHAVAVDGNARGLSIVKIIAEWGNRSSFKKACDALCGVLRGRHLVIRERSVVNEMKNALRDWERL